MSETTKANRPEIKEPTITTGRVIKPRRCLIYGGPGEGKTTFAAGSSNPVFIQTEDGSANVDAARMDLSTSYDDVLNNLRWLAGRKHGFNTVVLDSLDALERLIWDKVVADVRNDRGERVEDIEGYGFGKGYVHALNYWRELLRALDYLRDTRGMCVVLIAHAAIRKFDAPDGDPYERYEIGLDKRAAHTVLAWVDEAFFATQETKTVAVSQNKNAKKRGKGTGERVMRVEGRPAYMAKNRLDLTVDTLPLSWAEYESRWPGAQQAQEPADNNQQPAQTEGEAA